MQTLTEDNKEEDKVSTIPLWYWYFDICNIKLKLQIYEGVI